MKRDEPSRLSVRRPEADSKMQGSGLGRCLGLG